MPYLDHLNKNYPVRRTKEEKSAFRQYVLSELKSKGMTARVELTKDGKNENVVIGDPLTAKVVCTAHYDTPAASLFPNIMIPRNQLLFFLYQFTPVVLILAAALGGGWLIADATVKDEQNFMRVFLLAYLAIYYALYFLLYRVFKNPNNYNDNTSGVAAVLSMAEGLTARQREKVAFILFDNEEKGKKGSKAYYKDHEAEMKSKFLVNFDCVGNGENVIFVAMKEAEACSEYTALQNAFVPEKGYTARFYPIKGSQSNSDYKNFPCGVGCMACRKSKRGVFYTPYIHTPRDTVASNENITYITGAMNRFFGSVLPAANEE